MKSLKVWLRSIFEFPNTCPNGHKSVIMLPNGKSKCMDCQTEF